MALSVKRSKKRSRVEVSGDKHARSIIDNSALAIKMASESDLSNKADADKIAYVALRSAKRLKEVMVSDPSMELKDEVQDAIALFESIAKEIADATPDFPDAPVYKKEAFKEIVSDGSLCLGDTDFVVPEGASIMVPSSEFRATGQNPMVVTDEHAAAAKRVRLIVDKHIKDEE